MDSVLHPDAIAALEGLETAVDRMLGLELDGLGDSDLVGLVERAERQSRRLDALRTDLVDAIDRRDLHRADRHASAKVMVRHLLGLANSEAHGRAQTATALRDLPATREAFRDGEIGADQARRLARAHANPRVRDRLPDSEARLVRASKRLPYRHFDRLVTGWVQRADEDGTCDTNQRNHENRDARLTQCYDGSWELAAHTASLQGAVMHDILDHFVDAERQTDWEKARADHGDAACAADLPRHEAQRRADALWAIFHRAATTPPGGTGPEITTNVVVDHATYERLLAKLAGASAGPADPDAETYRCSTADGIPLEPTEAAAASLLGHVRRVVIGTDSVVIDLGRRRRLFAGSARLAARLQSTECIWPGCHVPASACQTDHTTPHRDGGCTRPGNGAPACGRHNRAKEHGYTVWRDPAGPWHVHRPDGSEIT